MTRARIRALGLIGVVCFAAVALALSKARTNPPPSERPTLLLLTSLPLVLPDEFSVQGAGSPALKRLQKQYRVVPISVTDESDLAKGRLLLMAQPRAQTAENLVTLDNWVRGGGHLMLMADPMLEWPSARPLSDPIRPSIMFADTGLLSHWGLRLDAPDERGPASRELGGHRVDTVSPGTLHGSCAISRDALVARCKIGKGEATIIADADVLNGGDAAIDGVLRELVRTESR